MALQIGRAGRGARRPNAEISDRDPHPEYPPSSVFTCMCAKGKEVSLGLGKEREGRGRAAIAEIGSDGDFWVLEKSWTTTLSRDRSPHIKGTASI